MALQQHLGDTRDTAKVTINLEGRMRIQHIGICTATRSILSTAIIHIVEQHTIDIVGVVAIQQTSPQIYTPTC